MRRRLQLSNEHLEPHRLQHPAGHLTGMSTPSGSSSKTCQNKCFTGLGTLWGTLVSAGRAEEEVLPCAPSAGHPGAATGCAPWCCMSGMNAAQRSTGPVNR